MVIMGQELPLLAIRQQIASGIDIVVQLGRMRDKSRKVLEIAEINGIKDGEIMLNSIFKFKETESKDEYVKSNKVTGELKKIGKLHNTDKLIAAGLVGEMRNEL